MQPASHRAYPVGLLEAAPARVACTVDPSAAHPAAGRPALALTLLLVATFAVGQVASRDGDMEALRSVWWEA